MPGKPTSGNRTAQRGKPTRVRRKLTKPAALALKLIAWQRHHRPTTDEEEDAILSELVMEEQERVTADPREGYDIDF